MGETEKPSQSVRLRVGWRLLKVFLIVLFVGIALNALILAIGAGAGGVTISLTVLLALPFFLSALMIYLIKTDADGSGTYYYWAPVITVVGLITVGGVLIREGVVCLIMVLPLWVPMAIWGALTVRGYQRAAHKDASQIKVFELSSLTLIPVVIMGLDVGLPQNISTFEVRRSIVLDATPEEIWPLLLELDDLSVEEGKWNVTQNLLQIPRPASALVTGKGEGAVRAARWGEHIRFEEHISDWAEHQRLVWKFVFPDDSISAYTDSHIHPQGPHLRIEQGGYELTELGSGQTRLELYTRYEAETPVNLYAALWGELILGDIQSNILSILDQRLD
ncbi:MAG: hypothetical protein CMK09_09465 [Ponticaulis sp.]|nr:hypothetical protein [Ponticaulis sp.]|tara:strand:+ start:59997 stop:60998 length:1002 start_codon:yes stop_codon:yes gene_type:complete